MYNFVDVIVADPVGHRQFRSGDHLMAEFTCPLKTAEQDMWSHASYFVYVLEGRKDWRSADGKVELNAGDMAFVKKGGSIVEQYFGTPFCVLLFFMTDEFICEVFRTVEVRTKNAAPLSPLAMVRTTPAIDAYMNSMLPHFRNERAMDPRLVDLCAEAVQETTGFAPRLPSGPLHDAVEMGRVMPSVMMFAQSLRGLSHCKEEDTHEADLVLSLDAFQRLVDKTIAHVAAG